VSDTVDDDLARSGLTAAADDLMNNDGPKDRRDGADVREQRVGYGDVARVGEERAC